MTGMTLKLEKNMVFKPVQSPLASGSRSYPGLLSFLIRGIERIKLENCILDYNRLTIIFSGETDLNFYTGNIKLGGIGTEIKGSLPNRQFSISSQAEKEILPGFHVFLAAQGNYSGAQIDIGVFDLKIFPVKNRGISDYALACGGQAKFDEKKISITAHCQGRAQAKINLTADWEKNFSGLDKMIIYLSDIKSAPVSCSLAEFRGAFRNKVFSGRVYAENTALQIPFLTENTEIPSAQFHLSGNSINMESAYAIAGKNHAKISMQYNHPGVFYLFINDSHIYHELWNLENKKTPALQITATAVVSNSEYIINGRTLAVNRLEVFYRDKNLFLTNALSAMAGGKICWHGSLLAGSGMQASGIFSNLNLGEIIPLLPELKINPECRAEGKLSGKFDFSGYPGPELRTRLFFTNVLLTDYFLQKNIWKIIGNKSAEDFFNFIRAEVAWIHNKLIIENAEFITQSYKAGLSGEYSSRSNFRFRADLSISDDFKNTYIANPVYPLFRRQGEFNIITLYPRYENEKFKLFRE
ncbi:MAG: hypothetical protein A2096_09430 [Spirochaetes bacterium GWF1_41_5]|nr:MAG: hypothetical protein A2096_09430 [Spirochaetes bacterium GWF1_41_5]HBE03778.1 hypothetical protein [Spirochaetia bacterium]